MAMGAVWTAMVCVSVVFSLMNGTTGATGAAVAEGAAQAVELTLRLAGPILLWSGVTELMARSGVSSALARLLRRPLALLFPSSRRDSALREALSVQVSANLLGLGNAATPSGIRAAERLHTLANSDTASDELCRLAVLSTASLQLLPTTLCALRASTGASEPFDILGAVWAVSLLSLTAGLLAERLLSRLWRR